MIGGPALNFFKNRCCNYIDGLINPHSSRKVSVRFLHVVK